MPDIYTNAWYDELKDLLNRNPDMEKSAPKGPLKVLGRLAIGCTMTGTSA